jgi:hypothetical protein
MLIEELIRLGQPLLEGDGDPQQVLRLITGVEDERVKNFYRHVFVVEIPTEGKGQPRALPMQQFGDVDADGDFQVDQQRAVGAPFVLPSGGNPLNPQGRYGLPVYPCYDPHLQAFRNSADGVLSFLGGRLERTSSFSISVEMVKQLAQVIHEGIAKTNFGNEKKILGVLILARCGPEDFYTVVPGGRSDRIGQTKDDRAIVPNYPRIIEAVWAAKVDEGREAGARIGECSFTRAEGEVVSAYCKAWPWAFPTWTCPLPNGGDERMLVEGIGVSPLTYRALTLGACAFNKLTRRFSFLVVPEIFSPANTRTGKDLAQRRNVSDLPGVYGSAFLLPVQDSTLDDLDQRREFTRGIRAMLDADPDDPTMAGRYMTAVTGFDVMLPDDMTNDFHLTLVYFSGDYTRGDVHLRACIQDVIPSTIRTLRDLGQDEARQAIALLRLLMPAMSEKQGAYLARCYESVPYLLARAYGGAYLWQQLETILHRRPLEVRRVTTNVARRLQSLVPQWPDSRYAVFDEVGFYLNFLHFQGRANQELAHHQEDHAMPMRHWKELLQIVDKGPVQDLALTDPAELGFACGALIKRFSRPYYVAMKGSKRDADYIRDRVTTFGTDLRPAAVYEKGLRMILELPNRLKTLKRNRDLEERAGAAIVAFQQLRDRVEKDKDGFITAFWAGYALQGYDRPIKPKTKTKQPITQV